MKSYDKIQKLFIFLKRTQTRLKPFLCFFQSYHQVISAQDFKENLIIFLSLTLFLTLDALTKFADFEKINVMDTSCKSHSIFLICHFGFLIVLDFVLMLFYKFPFKKSKITNLLSDLSSFLLKTVLLIFDLELHVYIYTNIHLKTSDFYLYQQGFKLLFIELVVQGAYKEISIKLLSILTHCFYLAARLVNFQEFSPTMTPFFFLYFFWTVLSIKHPLNLSRNLYTEASTYAKTKSKNKTGTHYRTSSLCSNERVGTEFTKESNVVARDFFDLLINNVSDCCILFDENDQIKYRNDLAFEYFPDPNDILIKIRKSENVSIKIEDFNVFNKHLPLSPEKFTEEHSVFIEDSKRIKIKDLLEKIRIMKKNFKESSPFAQISDEKWISLTETFECEMGQKDVKTASFDSHKASVVSLSAKMQKKRRKYTFLNQKTFEVRVFLHAFNKRSSEILCLFKDVSEEKYIQNLIVINENKSKAISFVSHEIRTPLNCIINMLKIVESKLDEESFDKIIKPAENSAKFLLNLVNDLLDMAQIEAGKFKLNYLEFDLKMLLSDTLTLIKIQAESRKIELKLNCDPKLSESIKSDPNRIRQVTINLLGNALKFTTKGVIEIKAKPFGNSDRLIKISVKDSGIGIKEEDQKKLFQAFGRLDLGENENLNIQGVGLGLLISNILSKNLGPNGNGGLKEGGLKVKSKIGEGSKFSFIIEDKNEENVKSLDSELHLKIKEDNLNGINSKFVSDCVIFDFNHPGSLLDKSKSSPKIPITSMHKKKKTLLKKNSSDNNIAIDYKDIELLGFPQNEGKSSLMSQSDYQGKQRKIQKIPKSFKIEKNFLKIFFPDKKLMQKTQMVSEISCHQHSKQNIDFLELEEVLEAIVKQNIEKKCDCFDILICDDNDFNILPLNYHLVELKFKVDSCFSGQEAVNKVKEMWLGNECCKHYEIIFMDIEMPVKNGIEATHEIMEFLTGKIHKQVIIGCTGHTSEKEKNHCRTAGMKSVMTKPISKGVLMNVLTKYIELKRKSYVELKEKILSIGIPEEKSFVFKKYKGK